MCSLFTFGTFYIWLKAIGGKIEEILESLILSVESCYLTPSHHLWDVLALVIVPKSLAAVSSNCRLYVSYALSTYTVERFFIVAGALRGFLSCRQTLSTTER